MSYRLDLDEMDEGKLREEIRLRETRRLAGLCDYCGRQPSTPPCKFPERHRGVESQTVFATAGVCRLARWLHDHPDAFTAVLEALQTPVAKCEGHTGSCEGVVLWPTPGMTAFDWNGEGEDPNRPVLLCPPCSEAYVADWTERWDEYRRSVLP